MPNRKWEWGDGSACSCRRCKIKKNTCDLLSVLRKIRRRVAARTPRMRESEASRRTNDEKFSSFLFPRDLHTRRTSWIPLQTDSNRWNFRIHCKQTSISKGEERPRRSVCVSVCNFSSFGLFLSSVAFEVSSLSFAVALRPSLRFLRGFVAARGTHEAPDRAPFEAPDRTRHAVKGTRKEESDERR